MQEFSRVKKQTMQDVTNFYDYLWQRRQGIMHLSLIDVLPRTMRSEVFYDINKFVFEQVIFSIKLIHVTHSSSILTYMFYVTRIL